jgi:hypothetical protein
MLVKTVDGEISEILDDVGKVGIGESQKISLQNVSVSQVKNKLKEGSKKLNFGKKTKGASSVSNSISN